MTLEQSQYLWSQDLLEWLEEIKTITNDEKKVQALTSLLAELLPSSSNVLKQALEIAQKDKHHQVESLTTLVPLLNEYQRQEVLEQILEITQNIGTIDASIAKALVNIAFYLSKLQRTQVLQKCLSDAEKINELHYIAATSKLIVPFLHEAEPQFLHQVIDFVQNIEDERFQADALAIIAPYLPEAQAVKVLEQALNIVQRESSSSRYVSTLAIIVPCLPKSQPQLLQEALNIAQNIQDYEECNKVKALTIVTPYLIEESQRKQVLQQALDIAQKIKYESEKIEALVAVVAHLKGSQRLTVLQQILNIMQHTMENTDVFAQALSNIVPYLPESHPELLQQALDIVRNMKPVPYQGYRYHITIVMAIVPIILKCEPKLLKQVINIAKKIGGIDQAKILANIAYYSNSLEKKLRLLEQTLAIVQNINIYTNDQVNALVSIIPNLLESTPQLLKQALDIAQKIEFKHFQIKVLASIAPCLPDLQRTEVLQKVLNVVQEIESESYRYQALALVAPHISESEPQLLKQAFAIVHGINDKEYEEGAKALVTITTCIPKYELHLLQQSLDIVNDILDKFDKSNHSFRPYLAQFLAIIAPKIPESESLLLQQALAIAQTQILNLNVEIPESESLLLQQAFAIAKDHASFFSHADTLSNIAPYLPSLLQTHALQQALKIADKHEDLKNVVHCLSQFQPQLLQNALESAQNFKYEKFEAIAVVLAYFSESQRIEILKSVLDSISNLEIEYSKKAALTAIIPLIPKSENELLKQVSKIAYDIKNEQYQMESLAIIAPYLPELETELIKQILTIVENTNLLQEKAKILAAFATKLPKDKIQLMEQSLDIIDNLPDSSDGKYHNIKYFIYYLSDTQPKLINKALEIAFKIRTKENSTKFLAQLAFRFPEEVASNLYAYQFSNAFAAVRAGNSDLDKTKFISALAPRFSSGLIPTALSVITEDIINPAYRAEAFSNLAPYLPSYIFSEALDLIENKIPNTSSQANALSSLIPYLLINYIPEALRIAQKLRGQLYQWQVLIAIASRLSNLLGEQSQMVLDMMNEGENHADTSLQATSLAPEELQKELDLIKRVSLKQINLSDLAELQKRIKAVVHAETSLQIAVLLINLAPKLYQAESRFFQQALELANEIIDVKYRVEALTAIAVQLSSSEPNLLQKILENTQKIHNKKYRESIYKSLNHTLLIALTQQILRLLKRKNLEGYDIYKREILCILIPKLNDVQLADSIEVIRVLSNEEDKAQALKVLVTRLFSNQKKFNEALEINAEFRQSYCTEALQITQGFRQTYCKVKVLSGITEKLPEAQELTKAIELNFLRTEALVDIASYSNSSQDQIDVLRSIRDLTDIPYLQCKYLESIVPSLQSNNLLEAQNIAQEIQDEYYKVKSLITLACKFPQIRAEVKKQAQDFKNKKDNSLEAKNFVLGIELLCILAIEVPEILPEILKDLEKVNPQGILRENNQSEKGNILSQWEQQQILIALKPHLPARITREINRERARGKISHELWYRSLRILRKTYRDALIGGSFRNDTNLNEDLLNLKDEIDALANMLLMRDLEPPVAVGILGGWGGGKSYILHLMQNRILEVRSEGITKQEAWNENPSSDELYPYVGHIYQIKFDAWTYAKSDLWASLMQTIFFELDRQISLEQQLIKIGIEPCAENSAKIWQVLYQVSEEDRNWFLERVLTVEQLQNFQDSKQKQDFPDNLWQIFTKSQRDSIRSYEETKEELINKEKELQVRKENLLVNLSERDKDLQERLADAEQRLQIRLDEIVADIREKQSSDVKLEPSDNEKKIHLILGYSAVVLERTLGDQGFNKIFDEKIQAEVNKKINLKINIKSDDITKVSSWLKGVVTVAISNNYQSITLYSVREWAKKNKLLIIIFFVCLLLAILLPAGIQFFNNLGSSKVIAQVVGFFTPMLPAIATLQALWTTGKKWYDETQLALNEYKTSYEQALEERVQKLVKKREEEIEEAIQEGIEKAIQQDERLIEVNEELASLRNDKINDVEIKIANEQKQAEENAKIRQLEGEVLELRNKLEKQQQELPENIYASLGEFISARINDGSYEKRLGIMHQVKQDLAALSYKLLPPPADSKDYAAKIDFLKKAFPRGPARVILYIDDLDRCSPDTVVQVLEAVQLLVKNRLFIAVVAIDERYINRALAKYYQGVLSSQGRPSPADYLEKIIQIPYRVTSIADSALRQYLKSQVAIQDSGISGNKFNEFSPEEFNILVQCCQEVDLSPRSLKRLTNVYKLFKVLNRIQGHKSSVKEQQAILALLAFSGRYPDLMRDLLKDIESRYEEYRNQPIDDNLINFFRESLQKHENKYKHHSYLYEELNKLRHDIDKVIPANLTLEDIKQIFDFVRRFSFVGDIGYDVDYQKGVNF